MALASAWSLSHEEWYVVQDAVEEFRVGLHVYRPLTDLNVSYDESDMQEVVRRLKDTITSNLMEKTNPQRTIIMKKTLESELASKVIAPFLKHNETRRKELKTFEDFVEAFCVSAKVLLSKDPYIDLTSFRTSLHNAKDEVLANYLKRWDPDDSNNFHKWKKAKLEEELDKCRRDFLRNQSKFLGGPVNLERRMLALMEKGIFDRIEQLKHDIAGVTRVCIPKRHLLRQVEEIEVFVNKKDSFHRQEFYHVHTRVFGSLRCAKAGLRMVNDKDDRMLPKDAFCFAENLDRQLKICFQTGNNVDELQNSETDTQSIQSPSVALVSPMSQSVHLDGEMGRNVAKRNVKRRRFDTEERADATSEMPRCTQSLTPTTSVATDEGEYPLILRLTTTSIVMATCRGDTFKRDKRELEMETVVGISDDGNLVCGNDVLNCRKICSIQDAIGGNDSQKVWKENVTFKLDGENVTREITVEFILGFLMKALKKYAEKTWNQRFGSLAITLPMWFPSSFRIQVKDAAKIAGFHHARLVNEESIAAYYLASGQQYDESMKRYILVLSENFGVVSGIIYDFRWGQSGKPKLSMVKNEHFKSECRGPLDLYKMKCTVDELCQKLCENKSRMKLTAKMHEQIIPHYAVFATQSDEWLKIFKAVAVDKECKFWSERQPSASDLFGASMLAKMRLGEMDGLAEEYLLKEIFLPGRGKSGSPQFLHAFRNVALPKKYTVTMRDLPVGESKLTFSQTNVGDKREVGRTLVGELDLSATFEYTRKDVLSNGGGSSGFPLDIIVKVSSEGIASLHDVEYRGIDGCGEVISVKGYDEKRWKTLNLWNGMNLSDAKREEFAKLMQKIVVRRMEE